MKVNTLTLAKGATLAMNPPYQHAHPPHWWRCRRCSIAPRRRCGMTKVPSLLELNARIGSPAGLKVAPPAVSVPAAAITPPRARRANAAAPPQDDAEPVPCAGKVCANCRTQKTPLWRNGPLGPKTLCNACGVRYKLGKLPPPGGWPPGHVPPPPPPRKRPAQMLAGDKAKRPKAPPRGTRGRREEETEKKHRGARLRVPQGALRQRRHALRLRRRRAAHGALRRQPLSASAAASFRSRPRRASGDPLYLPCTTAIRARTSSCTNTHRVSGDSRPERRRAGEASGRNPSKRRAGWRHARLYQSQMKKPTSRRARGARAGPSSVSLFFLYPCSVHRRRGGDASRRRAAAERPVEASAKMTRPAVPTARTTTNKPLYSCCT